MRRKEINDTVLFSESQFLRVKWVWALTISGVLLTFFLPFTVALGNKQGWKEAALTLLITVPLEAVILYLMYTVRLETIVSPEGIYYRWAPFFRKHNFIRRNDIETAIADDGPLFSYGFHFVFGYGWVYNMGPGKGIRFSLINGKRIFIGTGDIDSFQVAVDRMLRGKN